MTLEEAREVALERVYIETQKLIESEIAKIRNDWSSYTDVEDTDINELIEEFEEELIECSKGH
mgnify:CR=1 FL=1